MLHISIEVTSFIILTMLLLTLCHIFHAIAHDAFSNKFIRHTLHSNSQFDENTFSYILKHNTLTHHIKSSSNSDITSNADSNVNSSDGDTTAAPATSEMNAPNIELKQQKKVKSPAASKEARKIKALRANIKRRKNNASTTSQ